MTATLEYALTRLADDRVFRTADIGLAHGAAARVKVGVALDAATTRRVHRLLASYRNELTDRGIDYDTLPTPPDLPTAAPAAHGKPAVHRPIGRSRVWVDARGLWLKSPYAARDLVSAQVPSARWQKAKVAYLLPATPAAALSIANALGQYGIDADDAATDLVRQGHAGRAAQAHRAAVDLPPVPGSKTDAWTHQRQAFWFARELPGAILDMSMGLGKSKVVVDLIHDSGAGSAMIVCPERVVGVWGKQFGLHSGGEKHIIDPRRQNRRGEWELLPIAKRVELYEWALHECGCGLPHVLISNYAASAHEPFKSWSLRQHFDYLAYDECHRIRSHSGVWSKWAAQMHKRADRKLGGTGTMQAQTPMDVFGQARAVEPGVFGSTFTAFQRRYCNAPEAPVWMYDLSFKPIGEIGVGDVVMGWVEENGRRRLAPSVVEHVLRRTAPSVVRVTMESGRIIRCTPDHRWLSAHHGGTGEPGGPWVTVAAESRIERAELGEGGCGWCGVPVTRGAARGPVPKYCGKPHRDLAARARRTGDRTPRVRSLSHVIDPTPGLDEKQQAAAYWLAGLYDGEAHGTVICQSATHNPQVCSRIEESLDLLGVRWSRDDRGYRLLGGRQTYVDFLNWTRAVLTRDWMLREQVLGADKASEWAVAGGIRRAGARQLGRTADRVVSVFDEGPGEVVSMQTSTGNYVAWGYASKNCIMGGFEGREFKGMNPATVDEFAERLASFTFHAGEDRLDLPELLPDVSVTGRLSPRAHKAYRELEQELYAEVQRTLADGSTVLDEVTADNVLVKLLRLQQVTGGALPLDSGEVEEIDTGKRDLLADELEDIDPSEPVVVFARFHHDLSNIEKVAERLGRRYGELSGRRSDALAADATLADGVQVAGIQLQAGGTGVDFTRAAFGIYYSVGHSLADFLQSRKRLHRPGQIRPVRFRHLIMEGTVDEEVYAALAARQSVVAAIASKVKLLQEGR